jgi:hypothetical protein
MVASSFVPTAVKLTKTYGRSGLRYSVAASPPGYAAAQTSDVEELL